MYMLKNKILLAFVALVFGTALKAQTIIIDDARMALPAGYSYGSGSSVAVPISADGCFQHNNVFTWVLYNNTFTTRIDSGKVGVFYATFMNVTLPASLATGNYRIQIKGSTLGSVDDTTASIAVTNTALPVIAKATPVFSDLILLDQYYYGICDGNPNLGFDLKDSSTPGGVDSLILRDDYRGGEVAYTPNASGKFSLVFNPILIGAKYRDAYYTAFVKTIAAGNIVSTKAYHIINNSWDISVAVLAKAIGTQYSCAGDTVKLRVKIYDEEKVQQNFPGALVRVSWNDGPPQAFSQCQILAVNGILKHQYTVGACINGNTSFSITATVTNPFNVFNGPGLTGTCAAGARNGADAYVFSRPLAKFTSDTVVCANDTIKFFNKSEPGQGLAASGGATVCSALANYTWIIDGVITPAPLYQTPSGKVEPRKDTAYSFNSNQEGYHIIKLVVNNNYGTQSPCPSHDTTKTICVDTAKVRPNFMMDSSGVLKDSIIGCSPDIAIKNNTASTFCVNYKDFKYKWRLLDATSPGPNYTVIPYIAGGSYSYKAGYSDTSREPKISINKTGKYYIELNASASCQVDTMLRMLKYVEANGDAGVDFPIGLDTVYNCGFPAPLTINYSPTAAANTALFGNPSPIDSVHYTYQASSAGSLRYVWSVTRTPAAVYGTDYTYAGGLADTSLAYPKITFKTPGLYIVNVVFNNNCRPKTATQYVAYRQPVSAVSGGTQDSICHTTTSFSITGAGIGSGGEVGTVVWTSSGTGTFSPASGTPTTPNIFNPIYTPSVADYNLACSAGQNFTLTMNVRGVSPSKCSLVSSTRKLFIRPCIDVPDTELDGCSGVAVNYSVPPPLAGTIFAWTVINNFNSINGTTSNPGATVLNDVLTGNGYVTYQLAPVKDGCVGNTFLVTDTVRQVPGVPIVTMVHPNNATNSMCSGDTAILQISSANVDDLYNWTSFNHIGKITGLSTGIKQAGSIKDILINNTAPLLVDTAEYCIRTVTKYGCVGASNCVQIVVTPGPNVALVTEPSKLKYLCRLSSDTLKANGPGAAGTGTWTVKSYTGASSPVISNPTDSVTPVTGLLSGQSYYFQWEIKPSVAGCSITTDVLNIQVADTIPTPNAGNDTVICDANGFTQRNIVLNSSLSRPNTATEYIKWKIISKPTGNASIVPINTINPLFSFTSFGDYVIELRSYNDICADKRDTVVVKVFGKPTGGSFSISPNQSTFCQGTPITFTSNHDTAYNDLGYWRFNPFAGGSAKFEGYGQNPYVRPGANVQEREDVFAVLYSKGWNVGCRDSIKTFNETIIIDSATIAGSIRASDTVVCNSTDPFILSVIGNRGKVKEWVVSTSGPAGPYVTTYIGPNFSGTTNATSWYKAVVRNGNCSFDSTAPIRIYMPSGADIAKAANDTAVCGDTTILLKGNAPVVGTGYWEYIGGPAQNLPYPGGSIFTFGASPNDTTSKNPVLVDIRKATQYQFAWHIKNLKCDASADTITVIRTQPITNNTISTAADTVCSGTKVTVAGATPSGGSNVTADIFTWQYSTNAGVTWTTGSLAANSYSFTATTNTSVRRIIKSDSCYSYSNVINYVVQPNITNNIITPAVPAVCYNSAAPTINESALLAGGNGTYTYTWYYATNADTANHIWNNGGVNAPSYTPVFNLVDTMHFILKIVSGKCTDTSAIATVTVYPDAKASFTATKTVYCATQAILIDVPNPPALNTNFNWYADTVGGPRFSIGTGAGFPGYSIIKSLDSVKITLIASSTLGCKSDSVSKWFYTSATPFASFTVSADSGCANNTGLKTTSFSFTNTTPNANSSSFSYLFNYGDGTSTSSINPNPRDYAASTTGLDTLFNLVMTVTSQTCGSSQYNKAIKIRTRPKANFGVNPSYVCSGNSVLFTNATVGNNLNYKWLFGDAGQTVGSTNIDTVSHIYNVSTLTSMPAKLIAINECASDSFVNYVTVEANKVLLNYTIDGNNKRQCSPSIVKFYNNSFGGSIYVFDFGDLQQSAPSSKGTDTVTHTYTQAGTYVVKLTGSTKCGNVVKYDTVFVYETPNAGFTINPNTTVCIGDTIKFTNTTDSATSYFWSFGNSNKNPTKTYNAVGTYNVSLIATRLHIFPNGGSLPCSFTTGVQTVTIRDTMKANFVVTQVGATCVPYVALFTDNTVIPTQPLINTTWSFGDNSPNVVANGSTTHTYQALNTYKVGVNIKNAGGCVYIDSSTVTVNGPIGTWSHDTSYVCNSNAVNFNINANLTDSVRINFGTGNDTTILYATMPHPLPHSYALGGTYNPTAKLIAVNGCTYPLPVFGAVRVDYVKAAYDTATSPICGSTVLNITDKSTMDQNPAGAIYTWNIAGSAYTTKNPSKTFGISGVYNVRLLVTSVSGCSDSVATTPVTVKVNNIPTINSITRQDTVCAGLTVNYTVNASTIEDPIANYNWNFGNGTLGSGQSTQTVYGTPGIYRDTVVVITNLGCQSIAFISAPLLVNPSPSGVSINPGTDTLICAGTSLKLDASGAVKYKWSPNISLLPNDSAATVFVSPASQTRYVVAGYNVFGCSDTASVRVNTVNNYSISISATPNDSICKGDSLTLSVIGAPASSKIQWSPLTGVTSPLNGMGIGITVKPSFTTLYQVDVDDSAFCFHHSDTRWIGVGDTTKISLGLDTVYLQGGTTLPITASVINGPIATWVWTPATDLSCADCGNPVANVKGNVCYHVDATSIYGCKAADDICIIAFCEASQVFISNAFTPDGDGINDRFYVTANGIPKVISFRVFNRWGQVVFERSGYTPDALGTKSPSSLTSWDGKFKGTLAPTDVYVYTCEVVCANGTKFTYTGNVALIK